MRKVNRIVVYFIPQEDQRYPTVGDWLISDDGTLTVLVSKMPDNRHELLVAVHELVEALACNAAGVTQEAVDAFDMGPGAALDEPGDCPAAPYFSQHQVATEVEMLLAAAMGVSWSEYDAAVGDHGLREPACPT
jgi:hypothetical protein